MKSHYQDIIQCRLKWVWESEVRLFRRWWLWKHFVESFLEFQEIWELKDNFSLSEIRSIFRKMTFVYLNSLSNGLIYDRSPDTGRPERLTGWIKFEISMFNGLKCRQLIMTGRPERLTGWGSTGRPVHLAFSVSGRHRSTGWRLIEFKPSQSYSFRPNVIKPLV